MGLSPAKPGIARIRAHMAQDEPAGLPAIRVRLDSNESAFGPGRHAREQASRAAAGLERYCEQPDRVLGPAIAAGFGLEQHRITVGHGSDDLLSRLARAYLGPGCEMLHSANGYPKAPNYAHANDATPVAVADDNFTASVDALLGGVTERTRMVYLANPDNPSGSYLSGREMRRLRQHLPERVLLLLDCAYAEYVDAADYEPAHRLVEEHDNVVMTRTFSKIFGLAGARVGWLYASAPIIDTVKRIGPTFPVASPSLAAAMAGLRDQEHRRAVYRRNIQLRDRLTRSLGELGLVVYPSQTNFLLVNFPATAYSAAAAHIHLRQHGIAVRRFAAAAYHDCIRITLGLDAEMQQAQTALAEFLG